MNNYTIGEDFSLPSKGLVYDPPINPDFKLRSMTTNDEMRRLSPSDRKYKVMSDIIDDCVVSGLGVSAYDLCLGDYQYMLYKLRTVTYGSDYQLTSQCPLCSHANTDTISIDDMEIISNLDGIDELTYFELPKSKAKIKLKLQTPHLMDNIELDVREFKKKTPNYNGDSTILFTIVNLIDTIDGEHPNRLWLEKWARELPMMDTNYILKMAQETNTRVGVNTGLTVSCEDCGLVYNTPFRFTSEFYGPSIRYGIR